MLTKVAQETAVDRTVPHSSSLPPSLPPPKVHDWSWLTDRRRELSEKALMNQQQEREAAAEKAARRRERAAQKRGTAAPVEVEGAAAAVAAGGGSDDDEVVFVGSSSSSSSSSSRSKPTAPAPPGNTYSAMLAADLHLDAAVDAALRATSLHGLVDDAYLPALVAFFGGHDSALLLAALDFDEPQVLDGINALACTDTADTAGAAGATSSSSSSFSSSSSSSLPPGAHSPQPLPVDMLETWVVNAQHTLVRTTMRVLCGGCCRLKVALAKVDKTRYPGQLQTWHALPADLHSRLLREDPWLANVRLVRGNEVQPFSLAWVQWMTRTCDDIRDRFSKDVVSWMYACRPDVDAKCAKTAAHAAAKAAEGHLSDTELAATAARLQAEAEDLKAVDIFFYDIDADVSAAAAHDSGDVDNDDGDGNGDESEEEEDEVGDDDEEEDGWLFGAADHAFIGRHVRVFALSDEYWDEATVVAYLPPTTEDPLPLWKVRPSASEKSWAVDLEEHEVVDAMKRADDTIG